MLGLIILSFAISRSYSVSVLSKNASELDYLDSIIVQPIRNEDIPPPLCVLPFPFDSNIGGKIFYAAHWLYRSFFARKMRAQY